MNRQTHQLIWPRGWLMSKHITLYNTNIYCQGVVMLDFNQNKKRFGMGSTGQVFFDCKTSGLDWNKE